MISYRNANQQINIEITRVSKIHEHWGKIRLLIRLERIISNLKEFAGEREESRYTLQSYTEIKTHKSCMIPKNNYPKAIFDLLASVAYLLSSFSATFYLFFKNDSSDQLPTVHAKLTESFIAADFLLNLVPFLLTEFFQKFKNMTAEKIYFGLWLIPEFFALFPFYLLSTSLVWFRLFRIFTINRLITWVEESYITKLIISEVLIKDEYMRKSLIGLLKFITLVTITCHLIACIWYYISTVEAYPVNWMRGDDGIDKYSSTSDKYMASLYWTAVTFTSVGYGDIVPKTIPEYIFTMFVQFLGIMFFAYLMGNINSYIANIDKKKNALHKRENDLDKWIFELDRNYPDKVMPDYIYIGIREFYKFQWENDDTSIENFNQFMFKLPAQLRHEMNIYIYKSRIEYLGAFMLGIPENSVYELAAHMKAKYETRAVEVIKKDSKSKVFFIIKSGNVLVVDEEPFLRLNPRSYFGESCVLFNEKSEFRFITDGECTFFTINHKVFKKIAKNEFRVLALRAFRRNKYFNLVNSNLNKDQIDEELSDFIEDFNIFSEEIEEIEMQEFEVKLTKSIPSTQAKEEKYLRKIKEIQDLHFNKVHNLQLEVEKMKLKLEMD